MSGEGIEHRRLRIGQQAHVRFGDILPTGDRRAVEHDAIDEGIFVDGGQCLRSVLPLATRIGKAEVDVLNVVSFDQLEDFIGGRHAGISRDGERMAGGGSRGAATSLADAHVQRQ